MGCAAQQSGGVASVRERQVGVKEAGLPLDVAALLILVVTNVPRPQTETQAPDVRVSCAKRCHLWLTWKLG